MQKPTPRILTAVLLTLACGARSPDLLPEDRLVLDREIRAVMQEFTEAINDHDPERVMAFYSDSPEFFFLGCTSTITGGAMFKGMVGPTYSPERAVTFEKQIATVQILSPTAAVVSQRGRSSVAPSLFWTRVLVKEGRRWAIIYEHQSWPGCDPPAAPHPYTAPGDSAGLAPGGITR